MLDQFVSHPLLKVGAGALQRRNPVHHIARQVKAIKIIQHGHVERRGGCSLFLIAANVEVLVTVSDGTTDDE